MATPIVDPKSGAVIIQRTAEERLLLTLSEKVEALETQVSNLTNEVNQLKEFIEKRGETQNE